AMSRCTGDVADGGIAIVQVEAAGDDAS
nr:hypothetical protein [Tanacetum cinerariifolium]